MTDVKISDLPAAGTVNDADIFPMVQSGDTKFATIAMMKAAVAPSLATESAAGIIEIANQAEAESLTNDDKAMTSLKTQQLLNNGVVLDGATGGNLGDGTLNAKALYVNGEAVSGGGGLTLIASATPTGVTTVTFSSIPQTYSGLLVVYQGVSCSVATRVLVLTAYDPSATNYAYRGKKISGTTLTSETNALGTVTQAAAGITAGALTIMPYQDVPIPPSLQIAPYRVSGEIDDNGVAAEIFGGFNAISTDNQGIVELRFTWNSTGNFDAGTIQLYGIK